MTGRTDRYKKNGGAGTGGCPEQMGPQEAKADIGRHTCHSCGGRRIKYPHPQARAGRQSPRRALRRDSKRHGCESRNTPLSFPCG
ncbi:hypothetical protein NXV11_15595 [Bacteroides fragilis]|nr:hypothetical protein [Bacteroides fragilis]